MAKNNKTAATRLIVTVSQVNALLRGRGYTAAEVKLYSGGSYYYFTGSVGIYWPSVYVYRAADMTFREWAAEVDERIAAYKERT